jgi:hypothetical protein
MDLQELQKLIEEQEKRIPYLQKHGPVGNNNLFTYSYDDKEREYILWLTKTQRLLEILFPNDKHVNEFIEISNNCDLSPFQQDSLLAILKAFMTFPTIVPIQLEQQKQDMITINNTNANSNTQSQSQEQALAIHLFIEAIKDDLTGRQIKELKEIVAEADNDLQKARPNIFAKLKEFGVDVISNVVANILTNPVIWNELV